ncbi:3'-5' exonuclease-like [Aristolochia californica]|uniref:3'-5' exonuclease-like n=1 Tax=Aristolochia californica TaxID=171875 RepID=UPI0035E0D5DD
MSISIQEHPASSDEETQQLFIITLFDDTILATVTSYAVEVEQWISDIRKIHHRRLRHLIVGIDVEWRPNFQRNAENPVALLQLCVGRRCLIFQLFHADYVPQALVNFLTNPNFTFVGVGIESDVEKLLVDYGLAVSRQVDLRSLAADRLGRRELARAGLKTLAMAVLEVEVEKPKRVTMSRWDYRWLKWDQIQYACIDAFLSFEIGRALNASAV